MRLLTGLVLAFLLAAAPCAAQETKEWERAYTFEDSFVDLNRRWVFHDGDGVFRVTFRWSFAEPQAHGAGAQVRHQGRLEVYQVDCAKKLYRVREVTLLDASGHPAAPGVRNTDAEMRQAQWAGVTGKLLAAACRLVRERVRQEAEAETPVSAEEKAHQFALAFARRLERTQDFAPLIREFFAPDYLDGYLRDPAANYFAPLGRETAARATRDELLRLHTAALNAAYFSGLYVAGRSRGRGSEAAAEGKLLPPDVLRLVEEHPYTSAHRHTVKGYEYLSETIDSVRRLRLYTDLLEKVGGLFRKHAATDRRGQRVVWAEELAAAPPLERVCRRECLGRPAGTRLFVVGVPVFRLQLTEIDGELRVVSVGPY